MAEDALVAVGISKSYPGISVLAELDLRVEGGEVVAVAGASGTGKSTLLNIIGLLDHPDEGSLHLDGKRLGHQHFVALKRREPATTAQMQTV